MHQLAAVKPVGENARITKESRMKKTRSDAKRRTSDQKPRPSDQKLLPEEEILHRSTYVPHYLIVVTNGLVWHSSRLYVKQLGIGLNESRILTILADSGPLSAGEICRILSMNKGAVSRSLQVLEQRGYVSLRTDGGRRKVAMTPESRSVHRQIVDMARAREALLLQGFSAAEKTALLEYLQRMQQNIPLTRAFSPVTE
jgi:DNA-binding MarR family transcriptional regulator